MEHIVQFGISIDDTAIQRSVAANAERQIISDLKEQVRKIVFDYRYGSVDRVSHWTEQRVEAFLEAHKDEIIKGAVNKLADRLVRTKAAKEALADVLKGEAE